MSQFEENIFSNISSFPNKGEAELRLSGAWSPTLLICETNDHDRTQCPIRLGCDKVTEAIVKYLDEGDKYKLYLFRF